AGSAATRIDDPAADAGSAAARVPGPGAAAQAANPEATAAEAAAAKAASAAGDAGPGTGATGPAGHDRRAADAVDLPGQLQGAASPGVSGAGAACRPSWNDADPRLYRRQWRAAAGHGGEIVRLSSPRRGRGGRDAQGARQHRWARLFGDGAVHVQS